MRPLLLSVALLAAAAPPGRADPFAQHCDQPLPPARIQVRASFAEPAISFDLTAAQIKPLSQTAQQGVSFGLTQVETRVEQRVSLQALAASASQRLCGRPEIVLTLALHRPRIHVARELCSGTTVRWPRSGTTSCATSPSTRRRSPKSRRRSSG